MKVPFFRPDVSEPEVAEVVATLHSGWLTTGPRVRRFEHEFACAVCACHAVAVKSGIATLHSELEAVPFPREARLLGVGIGIFGSCIAALVWTTLPSTSGRRADLILRLPLAFAILHFGGCRGEAFSPEAGRREPG